MVGESGLSDGVVVEVVHSDTLTRDAGFEGINGPQRGERTDLVALDVDEVRSIVGRVRCHESLDVESAG